MLKFRWLVQHRMVDVVVSTAGGVEEDLIKCMAHTYMGDFALKGRERTLAARICYMCYRS
jgi:deoxyhypusine synthase